mmetsp:Transcript_21775/g.37139  ORF Transcript_21775/g.37139 Transcript_21775/m.37139 type:complete len:235 (+) Transcript_21775:145-849(+)
MDVEDDLELEEGDLLDVDDTAAEDDSAQGVSEDGDAASDDPDLDGAFQPQSAPRDTPGTGSGPQENSAKSSTLALDTVCELGAAEVRRHAHNNQIAHHVAQSVPMKHMMGTSMPVTIPGFGNRGAIAVPARAMPEQAMAQTFIPPHQYSVQCSQMSPSWIGESPGTALKRHKLRARNAILQLTGFLEPGGGGGMALQAENGTDRQGIVIPRASQHMGGLSRALGVGSPANSGHS